MNESKSTRYHRLARLAGAFVAGAWFVTLAGMVIASPAPTVRPLYVLVLAGVGGLLSLPGEFYRGHVLEHRFGLSSNGVWHWARQHALVFIIQTALLVVGAETVYALIRWQPEAWWVYAASLASVIAALLTWVGPLVLLPLFYELKPLARPSLKDRLLALSTQAGIGALGVYEWAFGGKTTRANAVLSGSGPARRILVSDTMLADYSDDEIEVILAHEIGHHVHRDIPKTLAVEIGMLFAGFALAALALDGVRRPLGLAAPWDIRGLPVLLLVLGTMFLGSAPLFNALSRRHERRADRYALRLTQRPDAFISAMRRLGAQNLVEESPSATAVWLFHTHPPIEERIAAARLDYGSRLGNGGSL